MYMNVIIPNNDSPSATLSKDRGTAAAQQLWYPSTSMSFTTVRASCGLLCWLLLKLLEVAGQTIYKPGELRRCLFEPEQTDLLVSFTTTPAPEDN